MYINDLEIEETKKHIFICVEENKPKCSQLKKTKESWYYLKSRINEINQEWYTIQRTKTHCLRVCWQWPIIVIYPDWVRYHSCNPKNIERIIQKHIKWWEILEDLLISKIEN